MKLAALLVASLLALPLGGAPADPEPLVGLWKAKRWFEPDVRGTLIVQRAGEAFTADIAGRVIPVEVDGRQLSFRLPNGEGSFRGRLEAGAIAGHWFDPSASPVRLNADGPNRWSGNVAPIENTFTFYLLVRKREDGSLGVVLNNPERDHGARLGVERLVRDGHAVKLIGKRDGQDRELVTGTYDPETDVLSLSFPSRGGTFDFRRDGDESDFYARGRTPAKYVYRQPPPRDDGWPIGTLADAGIDRAAIEKTIQMMIDTPMDSVDTPEVHALLVARHGKLVLEEYFHGEHRERLHDTRSASKSFVTLIAGAAMQAGAPLRTSAAVYQVMHGGTFPDGLEPRKRAITLEHLLTMTAGFECDDWAEDVPINEDAMWDNEAKEPDFYRYIMNAPMARDPGEKAVYCSPAANLAVGVIARATGESALDLFDRLIAGPMKIRGYSWPITPTGTPYGGGGVRIAARDFLKLGQLMLDGSWNGRRILSREFAARASSPLYPLNVFHYGYLWWSLEYPYQERKTRAFHAGGLGGQAVVVFPELDLAIATFGANYSSAGNYHVQLEIIPKHVLPAVKARK
ncbi:MAG TPA: serine hydrolase domain-containing protein [Thermoanaerobaculia bacterium]|nr:serine hydrolase domain-containing protein [Thermoanaerobaculia bacterium]